MKVIILAAGKGTRLGSLNENKPKCLLKINGTTLIERNLKTFKKAQLEAILVTGFKHKELKFLKLLSVHNHNYENTNMLWSLYIAKEFMDQDFLVCYSDILINLDQVNKLKNFNDGIGLLIDKDWLKYWKLRFTFPLDDAESLKISSENHIIDIGQKVNKIEEIQGQYTGFFKVSGADRLRFKKKLINFCEGEATTKLAKKAYLTDFLQNLIIDKVILKAIPTNGGWVEIDTPKDIESAKISGRLDIIENSID